MGKKFGIKKTKSNIFLLFLVGLLIGIVLGLRQPMPQTPAEVRTAGTTMEIQQ